MSEPESAAPDAAPARADLTLDAVFELLKAGKIVENAKVKRIKFRGPVEYAVRFRNCTLVQPEFDGATFAADVSFANCTVDRLICQKPTTFEKGFDVSFAVLSKAMFARLTVKGRFTAAHAEFRGKIGFNDCEFHQPASFWEARFGTWVDFKACEFHADADFRSVTCEQGFVLTKSTFHTDFLFRGSVVEKKFQADGSRFERCIDLAKAKLNDFAYLEQIDAGPLQRWAFLNAVADRIRILPKQVEGRLASEETGRFDEAMQEYGLLKASYQTLHRFDHEDWAFYRFKVCQRKSKPVSWGRPWSLWRAAADWLFLDVGCGYGTNPIRAVRMAAVIIAVFAALYAANVEMFFTDPQKLPFDGERTDLPNRLMIGTTTSVSVFTSGMGGIREVAKGWMNVPVMIESVMGTLLFGLFIVAFSRKVIR